MSYLFSQESLWRRLGEVWLRSWDLGFTAFGGPPVHFHILHRRFVQVYKWVDEQTYQELFALVNALPGPGSTKMGYAITLGYAGFIPALLMFFLWCLPGALGMFFLAVGVSHLNTTLPPVVYALLSGLNAATVGIIAVAALQLSSRAITDDLTRIIVIFVACAGICFNALWYFPVLLVGGAVATALWDVLEVQRFFRRLRKKPSPVEFNLQDAPVTEAGEPSTSASNVASHVPVETAPAEVPPSHSSIGLRTGVAILVAFWLTFIAIMVVRSLVPHSPVPFKLFANLYLAGTIIIGGGPVVIPLLREYVVAEGWVSSRDFLIGLAIIQVFPGPNFNFAIYLAALSASSTSAPRAAVAFLGLAIFIPGMVLSTGISSIWAKARRYRIITSALRGTNAGGVGLVWTAVYRLWQAGYLTQHASAGMSLSNEPWWIVVAVLAFSINFWFRVPVAVSIVIGIPLGVAWWGAVGRFKQL